jgi:hypothetical protein
MFTWKTARKEAKNVLRKEIGTVVPGVFPSWIDSEN